jgi:hypothetical protein
VGVNANRPVSENSSPNPSSPIKPYTTNLYMVMPSRNLSIYFTGFYYA